MAGTTAGIIWAAVLCLLSVPISAESKYTFKKLVAVSVVVLVFHGGTEVAFHGVLD